VVERQINRGVLSGQVEIIPYHVANIIIPVIEHPQASAFIFNVLTSAQHTTMLLPRLQPPLRAALSSIRPATQTPCLNEAFASLAINATKRGSGLGGRQLGVAAVRYASHKAQGAVNKAKDGPGKRLGAKKSGGKFH
jgi:hypothetical protein